MNSPDEILLRFANKYISNSNVSQSNFIHDKLLPSLTDNGIEKPVDHKTADEYLAWRSAKVKQINSVLNGKTNLPLKWLWCWIDVLPEPYRSDARKELFAQTGVLDVSVPQGNGDANIPKFIREASDVMTASSEVAADGKYDKKDDPVKLLKLADELSDVVNQTITEILSIGKTINLTGTAAGIIEQKALAQSPNLF